MHMDEIKQRKHKYVTQCLSAGHTTLQVWPSDDEQSSETKMSNYRQSIKKIASDPRVVDINRHPHHEDGFVFTIDRDINND